VKNTSPIAEEFLATGRCASCPVIDMHTHPDRYRSIYFPSVEPEEIVAIMDSAGVRVLVGAPHEGLSDPKAGNAKMARMIERFPDRMLGYWCVNPNYGELLRNDLKEFDKLRGFVGFKFLPSYHQKPLDGPVYSDALAYADERRLLVLSHTWGFDGNNGADHVRHVAERFPNVKLLLGHSLYGDWDTAVKIANEFPNVYLELTAAASACGIIEKFVDEVGSEKVVYGTDLPWFDPHYTIGTVVFAHISDDTRHDILHRNAERLLRSVGVELD